MDYKHCITDSRLRRCQVRTVCLRRSSGLSPSATTDSREDPTPRKLQSSIGVRVARSACNSARRAGPESFDRFKVEVGEEYEALDRHCEHLTESEGRIAIFTAI